LAGRARARTLRQRELLDGRRPALELAGQAVDQAVGEAGLAGGALRLRHGRVLVLGRLRARGGRGIAAGRRAAGGGAARAAACAGRRAPS